MRLRLSLRRCPLTFGVTLDPTERHGFEYQSWFGFSLFSGQASGEIGRGGSYRIGNEARRWLFRLYRSAD